MDEGKRLGDFKNLLAPDRMPCMTKVWNPVIPNRKERYLTPDELKVRVLHSAKIVSILNVFSDDDPVKRKVLERNVQEMLDEIGLARSLPIIRWIGICLNQLFPRITTGIYVNEKSLLHVKESVGKTPILYLPSHRSYADFVLMSYICFAYDLEIPGIAAGMDFHAMVGVGKMLRNTGAFFLRRSFSSDRLYWYVFKEYMRSLVNDYHIGLEFFIEGTRSRSFKSLPPKIGLLSMALEPLFLGEVTDITIVPIGFAYEKPLEEQLFAYEMLGVPKPKESTMHLFKALKFLNVNYGSMYVNFGKPISAREYFGKNLDRFGHAQLPSHLQTLSKNELNNIQRLATTVIKKQQQLIVLSTFNLISVYYNYRMYLGDTINVEELSQGLLLLSKFLRSIGAILSLNDSNVKSNIYDSIEVHCDILKFSTERRLLELMIPETLNVNGMDKHKMKGHCLSENTIKNSVPSVLLQLYINPCMFWMAQPAFSVAAINRLDRNHTGEWIKIEQLTEEIRWFREIFSLEFIFDRMDERNDFKSTVKHLIDQKIIFVNEMDNTVQLNRNNELYMILLSTIGPFLCCYLQVTETLLVNFSSTTFTEKEVFVKVQENVECSLNERDNYIHPYCLSLDSISIAMQSLQNLNYLHRFKGSSTASTTYSINSSLLLDLNRLLKDYCHTLPFNYLMNYLLVSKL